MERQDSNGFCFFVQNETIRKKVFKIDLKNLLKMKSFLNRFQKFFVGIYHLRWRKVVAAIKNSVYNGSSYELKHWRTLT